jgi:hypothetical protein
MQRCQERLDVAGRSGIDSITFAQRQPTLRAVVFDVPLFVSFAQAIVARYGMQEGMTVCPGNFFHGDFAGGTILSSCQIPCRPKGSIPAGCCWAKCAKPWRRVGN